MISHGPSVMRLADFVNGNPYKPEDLTGTGHPVIRIRQLLDSDAEPDLAEPPARPVWIGDGDLIFSWSATLAVRIWDRGRALLNQHLYRVDTRPGIHRGWFKYVLETGVEHLRPLMHGSTMTHITQDMLRSVTVAVPPPTEQRAIADYLDAETARIDALIAKKQQLLLLLEDRRTATTVAGVTGHLTHSGPFTPCDLPWASDTPSHWSSALLRLLARQGTGHTPSRERPEWWIPSECVVPWVTTGEVQQVRSDRMRTLWETREKISEVGIANSSAVIHPKGTVFLCRTASAGYSGVMGVDMATSQDFATWTCGERLDPEYLLLCLRAMRSDLLGRLATGSTHKTIYMPEIQGLRVPLPPIDEQRTISAVLKQAIDKSFLATDALHGQIDLLVEHRQALITSAVGGRGHHPDETAGP